MTYKSRPPTTKKKLMFYLLFFNLKNILSVCLIYDIEDCFWLGFKNEHYYEYIESPSFKTSCLKILKN